jgi:anhydro-N-acetylmuramic acid kinase
MAQALKRTVGLISGTSMDGIDVAAVETDGESIVRPGPARTLPYPPALKAELLRLLANPSIAERDPLDALERAVTEAFIGALAGFLEIEGLPADRLDLIGLHGQTIWHRPEKRFTRQLGSGALMAQHFGVPVVDGFRQADVAAGGQGAPLVPLYHAALASGLPKPLVILNLGGVANITWLGDDGGVIACDTGPASALIDDCVRRNFGRDYDEGGRIAASGRVDEAVLARLLDNPFFAVKPPKSLDRQDFHARAAAVDGLPPQDAVATLTAFTVEATARIIDHLPRSADRWLVAGGGRRNAAMIEGFAQRLGVPVEPVEAVGWDGDGLEAQCFGYLAARSARGLPLSLPSTTGAPLPMPGGVLHRP